VDSTRSTDSQNINGLSVELHGHAGIDTSGMKDVTQFVSSIRIGHSINPPWDTMTIQLQLPRHLLDLILTGDPGEKGHRHIHTGGWVVVRANSWTGDDTIKGPAIGFGCVENIKFAFQDVGGISDVPVQGTTACVIDCISWFTAAGRSNVRLAITDEKTTEGGIQDANSWFPIIAEAITNSTSPDLGYCLQQLWEKTCKMATPDTLTDELFGNIVPVVYNAHLAGNYAPDRAGAMLPVRGQSFLNLPVILPESDLWQWLGSTFVPDANIVELFPSLEYPHLGPGKGQSTPVMTAYEALGTPEPDRDIFLAEHSAEWVPDKSKGPRGDKVVEGADRFGESTVPRPLLTQLGAALKGANPVLVYRLKPYLMHPINQENWGRPTMSEKLKINQVAVRPEHRGPAAQWYVVTESEGLSMDVEYSESDRVNMTFVRPSYMQTGALRAYTQVGQVTMPKPLDFNRYGLRAYEPTWPYIPEGTPVSAAETAAFVAEEEAKSKLGVLGAPSLAFGAVAATSSNIMDDFTAMNELVWALCGSAEKFAHATLRTRAKPWCRAGHWMSGSLGMPANGGPVTLVHWTGYIEAVEHTFEVDRAARIHTGSVFRLARVSFSKGSSDYYTPTDDPDKPLAGDHARPTDAPPVTAATEKALLKSEIKKGVGANSRHTWLREFAEQARPVCKAANFPLSLCLAQATLESQWGEKHIGKANNYFGIKAASGEKAVKAKAHEYINDKKTPVTSSFRVFASAADCVASYVNKLSSNAWVPPGGTACSVASRALWIWAGVTYATSNGYTQGLRAISKEIAKVLEEPDLEIKFNQAQLVLEKEMIALPAWITTRPSGVVSAAVADLIDAWKKTIQNEGPVKYKNTYPRKIRAAEIRAAGNWPA